jgi:hypothetical protein
VNIRPGPRLCLRGFVRDQDLALGGFELDVGGLCGAAVPADAHRARVGGPTVRAGPLELYFSDLFLGHKGAFSFALKLKELESRGIILSLLPPMAGLRFCNMELRSW